MISLQKQHFNAWNPAKDPNSRNQFSIIQLAKVQLLEHVEE